jgi:NAD(P)-dependent dehydrogenase (short-subunit alcohol dehydrogenase family)
LGLTITVGEVGRVRVNGSAPGIVPTDSAMAKLGEVGLAKHRAGQVLDQPGEVRDVVAMMLFLFSDDAQKTTTARC